MAERTPVVLVTGGSRGIGAAVVRRFVQLGYSVCFTYRQDDEAAQRVVTQGSAVGTAQAVRAEVTDPTAMTRAFDVADSWAG